MQAEKSLNNLIIFNNLLKRVLDEISIAFVLVDSQGEIVLCSQEACRILDLMHSSIVGLRISDLFFYEEGQPLSIESIRGNSESKPISLKLCFKNPNGARLIINCQVKELADQLGPSTAWLILLKKRVGFEDTLEESILETLNRLFQVTPQPIAFINGEGRILKINPATCQLMGLSEDQIVGKNGGDFMSPFYKQKFMEDIHSMREGHMHDLDIYEIETPEGRKKKFKIRSLKIGQDAYAGFINDVTSLDELATAAQDSKQNLENFFALAEEGFFIAEMRPPVSKTMLESLEEDQYLKIAEQTFVTLVNAALAKHYYEVPEAMIGRPLMDFLKHQPAQLHTVLRDLFQTGKAKYELPLYRSNGEMFMAEGSLVLVYNERDDAYQLIGVQRDKTQWQQLRNALAEVNEKLRLAQEIARIGTWEMDLITGAITRNNTWYTMLGYEPGQMGPTDQDFLSLLHGDDLSRINQQIEQVLHKKLDLFEAEFRLRTKEGNYRWVKSRAQIFKNEEGEPVRVIGAQIDIDDYYRLFEQIKLSESTFKGIIDNISDAVYIQNEDGIFLDVNRAAELMYGYRREEFVGRTPEFLSAEGKNDLQVVAKALKKALEGEPQRFKFWGKKADGSIFPKEVILNQGTYFGVPCVIAVARDITDQIKRELELRRLVEELHEVNSEKDKFFSIIAHDLKSPLSAMIGITELLAEDAEKLTLGEIKRLSRSLQASGNNVYRLLENLLEWSRIKRGLMDFNPSFLSLRTVVAHSMENFVLAASQKQIGLLNAVGESFKVFADERMLETILRNLLSNAIKFTERGGFIKITAYQKVNGFVGVEVKDTGIGIPEDLLTKIFSVTGNGQRKGTDGELSTGLGLPLCKELVEIHGGKIWAENNSSKGSRLCFTLPSKPR